MALEAHSAARGAIPRTAKPPPHPGRWQRWKRSEAFAAWLFLLPSLVGFLVFTAGPVLAAAVISLLDWNLFSPPSFAGLGNFARLGSDPTFWTALGNTAYFTFVSVPLTLLVSLGTALLLNHGLRRMAIFRSLLLLPYATITVAVAFVWIWLYIPHDGLVNSVLGLVGIHGPAWLVSEGWAMPALILMSVWKSFGFGMVIFLAGLAAIPQQLYEAARVDGATPWQSFRKVTLPLLSPSVFFTVVTSVIGSFQVFDQALIMTDGGPGARTTTLVMYIYQTGFENYDQGYAAAQSLVLFAFVAVITGLQFLAQRRLVHYDV
ncbi:carbohydrate ABC transporter permease [Streptomyces sp. TS71-3]|uniref:carbohydrate ABC transporter permease n=1 Tax=Streptomyces sp. TS71-3 TaxID=2733862 RepID=UPI001B0E4BC7|nr:sugar ABC transporter permease [Streptomyces sp. TS71-3]GHJ40424.1 sugar ABC transporter permease [Streptomyces sp. TS71-3]